MMQLGVSLFFENDEEGSVDEWQSRRYNFYCYPGNDHQIVMNPSSIAFLQQHGLSLDLWTKQGISNEREAEALDTIEKYHTQKEEKRAGRKIQLTRAADVDFHGMYSMRSVPCGEGPFGLRHFPSLTSLLQLVQWQLCVNGLIKPILKTSLYQKV